MPAFQSAPIRNPLRGAVAVPGDKSISHRALIFGALSVGETRISNLLEGDDVLRTAAAVRQFGARVERGQNGVWTVQGCGVGGLHQPGNVLDLGNSGTGVRLLMGVAATLPFTTFFCGDESLSRRPMKRVFGPLEKFGASFLSRDGLLPCAVTGPATALPIQHRMTVASAQVKSAILLAGLNAPGETTVIEKTATRDHTERMLRGFGAHIASRETPEGTAITLVGQPELTGQTVLVPADPSSASFFVVAASLIPDSDVTLAGISLNPLRTGLFDVLREMGASIEVTKQEEVGGEPIGDIRVRSARLSGVEIPPERAPSMIDEYPILSVAAAAARGKTVMRGLEELRVKESDRVSSVAAGLRACGVDVEETEDGMTVHGRDGEIPGGGRIQTHHDHRIAMAFAILGMAAQRPVVIDDDRMIATSFPDFTPLARGLGADITAWNG